MIPSWILEREARITASKIRGTEQTLENLKRKIPVLLRETKGKIEQLRGQVLFSKGLKKKLKIKENFMPTSEIDKLMARRRNIKAVKEVMKKQKEAQQTYQQYQKTVKQYNVNLRKLQNLIDYYNSVSFRANVQYKQEQEKFIKFVAGRTTPEQFYNIMTREGYINPKKYTREQFFKDIGYQVSTSNFTRLASPSVNVNKLQTVKKITPDSWVKKPQVVNIPKPVETIKQGATTTYVYRIPVSNMKNKNLTLTYQFYNPKVARQLEMQKDRYYYQQFKKNFEKLPTYKKVPYLIGASFLSNEGFKETVKSGLRGTIIPYGLYQTYKDLRNKKQAFKQVKEAQLRGVYELAKADVKLKEAEKVGGLTYTKTAVQELVLNRPISRIALEYGIAQVGTIPLGYARAGLGRVVVSAGKKVVPVGSYLQKGFDVGLGALVGAGLYQEGKKIKKLVKEGKGGVAMTEGLALFSGFVGGGVGMVKGSRLFEKQFKPNEFFKLSRGGFKKVTGRPYTVYAFENVVNVEKPSGSYFLSKGKLKTGYIIEGKKLPSGKTIPFEVETTIFKKEQGRMDKLVIDFTKNKVYDYRKNPVEWFRQTFTSEARAFGKKGKVISRAGSIGQTFGFVGKKGEFISSDIFLTEKGKGFGITTGKEEKYIGVSFVEDLTKNILIGGKKRGIGAIVPSEKGGVEMFKRVGLKEMSSKNIKAFKTTARYTTSEAELMFGQFGKFKPEAEVLARETFTFEVGGSRYYVGKGRGGNRNILKELADFYKKKPKEEGLSFSNEKGLITKSEEYTIAKAIEKTLPKLNIKPVAKENIFAVTLPEPIKREKTTLKKKKEYGLFNIHIPTSRELLTLARQKSKGRQKYKQPIITAFMRIQKPRIIEKTTQKTEQVVESGSSLFTPRLIPVPPVIAPPKPPKVPVRVPRGGVGVPFGGGFPFGFGGFGLSKKGKGKGKSKYAPSVVAVALNIVKKVPAKGKRSNVFEIRPLLKPLKFPGFGVKPKTKRKKAKRKKSKKRG